MSQFNLFQSLSRQSSCAEDRINSSDEDEFLEERSGGTYQVLKHNFFAVRPNSYPQARACKRKTLDQHRTSSLSIDNSNQPDLIKEVLAQSIKISQTESDMQRLQIASLKSTPFEVPSESSFCGFGYRTSRRRSSRSDSITRVSNESKIKKKRKQGVLSRSCIAQWTALVSFGINFDNFMLRQAKLWARFIDSTLQPLLKSSKLPGSRSPM